MKKETITTAVTVTAKDIENLGFTYYCDEHELMSFSFDFDNSIGLHEIFLRSILKCFGNYNIIDYSEYTNKEISDLRGYVVTTGMYHTNLPKRNFVDIIGDGYFIENIK